MEWHFRLGTGIKIAIAGDIVASCTGTGDGGSTPATVSVLTAINQIPAVIRRAKPECPSESNWQKAARASFIKTRKKRLSPTRKKSSAANNEECQFGIGRKSGKRGNKVMLVAMENIWWAVAWW